MWFSEMLFSAPGCHGRRNAGITLGGQSLLDMVMVEETEQTHLV